MNTDLLYRLPLSLPYFIILLASYFSFTPAQAQSNKIYQDIYFRETPEHWLFGNANVQVILHKKTGAWLGLKTEVTEKSFIQATTLAETFDVKLNEQWLLEKENATLLRHQTRVNNTDKSATLELVFGVKPQAAAAGNYAYEITCRYRLLPGKTQLYRSASLRRTAVFRTAAVEKFGGFLFKVPHVVLGTAADCVLDAPGPFFPNTFLAPATPLTQLQGKDVRLHSAPDAGFGIIAVSNSKQKITLAGWMETRGEVAYFAGLKSDGQQVTMRFHNDRTYRFTTKIQIDSDEQRLQFASSLTGALAAYRQMCEWQMPLNNQTPADTRDMVLLEVYPKYFPAGFKGITQKLSFYRQVGFNTIYLMPHWLGGYSPIDFYTVDPAFGTPADLKEMVRTAHSLGMKVLFDMVIHGFNDKSPVTKQRPELFVHDERGNLALHPTWKSVTTDWASPVYQQYMADVATHHAKEYGIDGYRLDAATYKGPNWDSQLPYPAYRSGSAAPELMKRMLAAVKAVNPQAVMLSEVFGPVFYNVDNLVHDNQTEGPQFLLEKMAVGNYTAQDYKMHIQNVLQALPAGANRVYFARNHDTSWFYHFNGYTPAFMALEAIHALCAIPEVFAGDPENKPNPDDSPAIYNYYQKLFALRQEYPEFTRGELLLPEVISDNPMVFTALRRLNNKLTLTAISLSGKPEQVKITVSEAVAKQLLTPRLTDGLTKSVVSTQNNGREITLTAEPYQVIVGRL